MRLIVAAIGARRIQDLTPVIVQRRYRAWADAGVGARSIELAHLRLRQIMDLAVRWKIRHDNPAADAKPAPVKPKARRVWTEDEARRFLTATESRRFHLLWSLILATGLRRGEALGLRWADLDLEAGVLRVRQTVELIGGQPRIGEPKSKASQRAVDLSDGLRDRLVGERD